MNIKQKFNEYIASGDIAISDEQRDWILPFIERCVGENGFIFAELKHRLHLMRKDIKENGSHWLKYNFAITEAIAEVEKLQALTQEDKIK